MIYDEVFTGFWRLGATSGAQLLGAAPDIACYAKLLTGGLVPLAATLATDAVFSVFEGEQYDLGAVLGRTKVWTMWAVGWVAVWAGWYGCADGGWALPARTCTPLFPRGGRMPGCE